MLLNYHNKYHLEQWSYFGRDWSLQATVPLLFCTNFDTFPPLCLFLLKQHCSCLWPVMRLSCNTRHSPRKRVALFWEDSSPFSNPGHAFWAFFHEPWMIIKLLNTENLLRVRHHFVAAACGQDDGLAWWAMAEISYRHWPLYVGVILWERTVCSHSVFFTHWKWHIVLLAFSVCKKKRPIDVPDPFLKNTSCFHNTCVKNTCCLNRHAFF